MEQHWQNPVLEKIYKAQPVIVALLLLAFVGKTQHYPGSAILLIITAATLAWLYFMKSATYIDMEWSKQDRIVHRIIFLSLTVGVLGLMFHLQHWPGAEPMSVIPIFAFCFIFLFLVTKKSSVLKFLNMVELSSLVLILIYFARVYMSQL